MTTVTIFKALADETRLRLLRILLHHELSVNELVSILKMGQSRISRHLRVLSDAGLTTFRRDGLWVFYQANQDADVQKFLKTLAPYLDRIPEAPEDTVETNRILEEKNAKTQHFFNSVAENWDNLNKKILGSYDLRGHPLQLRAGRGSRLRHGRRAPAHAEPRQERGGR